MVFSTLDWEQLAKTKAGKKVLKSVKLLKLKVICMLKTNEDIALQSRDVVEQCFARFGGITFKLGTFSNSNVLVPPVSMEFCLLFFVKT